MSQSLSKVYIHCVFSTKGRKPFINQLFRNDLHAYIVGTMSSLGSYVQAVYANPDHVHILCTLPRTMPIAELISKTKTASSKWIKKQGVENFSWQNGYAVFSVSQSGIKAVENYILNQEAHHRKKKFQDEYLHFLKEYGVAYDERYIWD
jgi:REP element-mobilizing transposase RayT